MITQPNPKERLQHLRQYRNSFVGRPMILLNMKTIEAIDQEIQHILNENPHLLN